MAVSDVHYYDIVYKVSSFSGMWPYLKLKTRIFRVTFLTIISLTLLIPEIAYQFMCENNVQCTYQVMTAYLLSGIAMLKMYTFQRNIPAIRDLTQHLFVDWQNLKTLEELNILRSYAEYSRRFSLIYLVYLFIGLVVFMSISLVPYTLNIIRPLNQSRPTIPPYWGYYFVDYEEYFFQIYCHGFVAWAIIMIGIAAHDTLFVTYVEHICSMFALIGFHFERLFSNDNTTAKSFNSGQINVERKNIACYVQRHRDSFQCAQLLESIFSVSLAIQILIVTILMSISLLQITQRNSDYLQITRYVFYVVGQLIHIFFLSSEGQKLMDHSYQIRDKIYHSSWYEVSPKSQKMIMIAMTRSFRPALLSAGKVYIFCLESFTMILQTSMSYLTVLASFQ